MPSLQVNPNRAATTPQNGRSKWLATWFSPSSDPSTLAPNKRPLNRWQSIGEVLLLAALFGFIVGQPVPDVNETHYLAKAKHFWNPKFCEGDLFLSSSFSHYAFYVLTGWITLFLSLETYAWIGRIGTWVFLAAGWCRVCRQLFAVPMIPVISGLFFVVLNLRFHLAGEWVVGGFEAKGIAFGFVLFGIASMLQQKWNWVWPLLGCASAFHVLVGGWATLAAGGCCVYTLIGTAPKQGGGSVDWPPIIRQHLPALVVGFLVALIGIVPPLMAESGSPNAAAAHAIYVSQRVAHHVNFATFPIAFVARFVTLIFAWRLFGQWYQKSGYLDPKHELAVKLLEIFTLMTLVFSFAGLVLSGMAEQGGAVELFANRFLRFYCFRLADFAVPASVALLTGCILSRWVVDKSDFPHRVCSSIFMGCILVAGVALALERHADGRPNADVRTLLADEADRDRTQKIFRNWKNACRWISNNTPSDAVFITPDQQQTFKWYAHRAEVCCWKDVPQDPDAMAQWRERIKTIVEPQRASDLGIFVYSDEQILDLAARYGATHLIALQRSAEVLDEPTAFRQVYPEDPTARVTWAVFELKDEHDE